MFVVCLDLEGVLIPEIWIGLADRTGLADLRITTREEPDYDRLMAHRLDVLRRNGLGLADVQAAAESLEPLPGAPAFLERLRATHQVIILSDTFYEFTMPLMRKLGWPTLFCHTLEIDGTGQIAGYRLRIRDHKREAVKALRALNFKVLAAGDSYNDTGMLSEAHFGAFYRAPGNVTADFPGIPAVESYDALEAAFGAAVRKLASAPR